MISNRAKKRLKDGKDIKVFNVFDSLRPSLLKVVTQCGYDVILIETEHVLHNPESLTNFLIMCNDNSITPVVTVPSVSREIVSPLLDAGTQGILLSHAEEPGQIDELVQWAKYPPIGERALAHAANAEYRISDAKTFCGEVNDSTLLILKIESWKGIENAEKIVSNPWVDSIVFGPGDLAADMGLHGEWEHPDVISAMEKVVELALANGKSVEAPVMASSREQYLEQRAKGIQIFGSTRSNEYDLLRKGASENIASFLPEV